MTRKGRRKKKKKNLSACRRKKKYKKDSAWAMARRKNERLGTFLHAYKCPVCHHWHIGRVNKWARVRLAFERLEVANAG